MNSKFTCEHCDKNHNSLENLNRHIDCDQTCEKYKGIYFFCNICKDYMTKGNTYLKKHKRTSCKKREKNYMNEFKDLILKQYLDNHAESLEEMKTNFANHMEFLRNQMEFQRKIIIDLQNENHSLRNSNKNSNDVDDDEKVVKYRKANSKHTEIIPQQNRENHIEEISKKFDTKRQTSKSLNEAKIILKQYFDDLPSLKYEPQQKSINEMKKIRMDIFKITPYDKYKLILDDHIKNLTAFFNSTKNYQDKRLNNHLLKSLNPIESRILSFPNYHTIPLERDEIDTLESCLEFSGNFEKEFTVFSNDYFLTKFHNFGSVVLSIKKLIKNYLFNAYGFNNYIYLLYKKSSDDDPYSFYRLVKIEKGILHWEIDCRAEHLTNNFISDVLPYLIFVFRKIYRDIFHDNIYRKDYCKTSTVTEYECEQLLRNIFILSDQRQCCDIFRELIKEHASKNADDRDKFSMFGDDSIQREKFINHKINTDNILNTISTLFDNMNMEDAVDLLREKHTYN
jgi:hypothetical protein